MLLIDCHSDDPTGSLDPAEVLDDTQALLQGERHGEHDVHDGQIELLGVDLAVGFLLAAGALALTQTRRALGWSAIGVATITLVGTAVSLNNLGQMSGLLWFAWIVYASIAIARGKRAPARAVAVTQNA